MKRALESIKGRIFLLLLGFTSLLLIAVGLFFYYDMKELVFEAVDRTLHSKAQVIAGLLHKQHNTVQLEVAEVILGDYSIPRSGHYYQVMMNDRLLAFSPSLVNPELALSSGASRFRSKVPGETIYTSLGPDGEPIRVLRKDLKAFGNTFDVFVADSLEENIAIIRSFRRFLLIVIPSAILVVCLTGSWIAKRALAPLSIFSRRIDAITHKTLGKRIDTGAESRELKGLALAFNGMLDRLQKVFESEKRLIADASHELKTPLSIIRAQCDITLQRERTKEEYAETIGTIREVSVNVGTLVRDLLSLARLDSGILSPIDFKPLSLNECLEQVIGMVTALAEEMQVRITEDFKEDICVGGDRDSLTEAFLNLAENGIKYNKAGGTLKVSTCREGTKAVISIRDTGPGIRDEEKEAVFDRFYRSDTVRGAEGTGLGLSITRAIIEAHGGKIELESEPGKGCTFIVALPANGSQDNRSSGKTRLISF